MSDFNLSGFKVTKKEFVKDINSEIVLFEHEKSGARLIHIKNEDDNKVFSIGFKTPPEDSTGVMHILEHSVLCGSKNFPSKEPFVELCKGSMNTFLNAMTYSDKTVYPVSSRNEKDFMNLMHVYLDAVFYPNIYTNDKILKQEGWNYHIEDASDDIVYNGVVYNEMKGAYSSPTGKLFRKIQESLYPDNAYSHDSGGNPEDIINLTNEQFLATHKKLYHPSNSYIALSGDINLEEVLEFIDKNYLSNFEKSEEKINIEKQKTFNKRVDCNFKYSVATKEQTLKSDYLAYNLAIDTAENNELNIALDILIMILLHSGEAPLKQALIDADITNDCFGYYDAEILQPTFSIIAKDCKVQDKNKFVSIIEETLRNLVANGISKDLIEGCINIFEFDYREGESGSTPKGLNRCLDAMGVWIHDINPIEKLKFEKHFSSIKKALTEPYFEELIEKYILNNNHSSIVTLEAELDLSKKEDDKIIAHLKNIKDSLSKEEINDLVKNTKELKEYQSSEDSEEVLKSIPMLSLDDVEKNVADLKVDRQSIEGVDLLHYNIFTEGIGYISAIFDTRGINENDIAYIGLLSDLMGELGTSNQTHIEMSNRIMSNMGGMSVFVNQYKNRDNKEDYEPTIEVKFKVLKDKIESAFEIANEIVNDTSFENKKKIKEIINERISGIEMTVVSAGHSLAVSTMNSYYDASCDYVDKVSGLKYYEFLKGLDIDSHFEEIKTKLNNVRNVIFNKNNARITVIGSEEEKEAVVNCAKPFLESLNNEKIIKNKYTFNKEIKNEALLIPSEVQYIAKGYNFKELGYKHHGSMNVLTNLLKYSYLWNEVRVKGGAYGAMMSITETGNFNLCSYRDPNIEKTINTYKNIGSFIENLEISERELHKTIIGTMSNAQLPLSPQGIGKIALLHEITGRTKEDRQEKRNEILNTSIEDLRSHASMINDIMKMDCQVAVGNEKLIESKELFKNSKRII